MTDSAASKAQRPRASTAAKRQAIIQAAVDVFGTKGYTNGSLAEIADIVGMTHAGVLHHFGSKDQLLLEVLTYRDRSDVENLEGHHMPDGLELFRHLVRTAGMNEERSGIVQAFAVLSADSVTDGHPAKPFFTERYETLRALIRQALVEICDPDDPPESADLDRAAAAVIAVMDGLQIQWLLSPVHIHLAEATAFAIDAILAAAVRGRRRRVLDDGPLARER